MPRRFVPSLTAIFAAASAIMLSLAAAGCSGGDEQQIIRKYFEALRLRDQSTVANMATVEYDMQREGTVQNFSVKAVSPEQTTKLNIKELATAWRAAKDDNDAFQKEIQKYLKENAEEIDRVQKASQGGKKLSPKDAALQSSWQNWVRQRADHSEKLTDSRRKLAAETRVAEISTFDARQPIDVNDYDGNLISKDVTIDATLKRGDTTTNEQMIVTLQRAALNGPKGERQGRWIITDIHKK
ncbi:MAG: hypothetical protein ACM36C_13830 [Acidobacteriota bacterium]